jgi:hypothetical protein
MSQHTASLVILPIVYSGHCTENMSQHSHIYKTRHAFKILVASSKGKKEETP